MSFVTGIDIIKISRLGKSTENPRFLKRVFGPKELALYKKKPSLSFLAGNFAAKEAFSKALGTGIRGFKLTQVEALRDPLGKPFLHLTGQAKELAEKQGLSFSLSISHEQEYAVAFVIGWSKTIT